MHMKLILLTTFLMPAAISLEDPKDLKADIVILVDVSYSIADEIEHMRQFLIDQIRWLSKQTKGDVRIGVVTFGKHVKKVVDVSQPLDLNNIINQLSQRLVPTKTEEETCMGQGLVAATEQLKEVRNDTNGKEINRFIILITDGKPGCTTCAPNFRNTGGCILPEGGETEMVRILAEKAKQKGILILGVGVNTGAHLMYLRDSVANFCFFIDTFDDVTTNDELGKNLKQNLQYPVKLIYQGSVMNATEPPKMPTMPKPDLPSFDFKAIPEDLNFDFQELKKFFEDRVEKAAYEFMETKINEKEGNAKLLAKTYPKVKLMLEEKTFRNKDEETLAIILGTLFAAAVLCFSILAMILYRL